MNQKSKELECSRIFLDFTQVTGIIPDLDRFEIGTYVAQKMRYKVKISVFDKAGNVNKFAETVAQNRGGNMRVFTDKTEALDWLLGTKPV